VLPLAALLFVALIQIVGHPIINSIHGGISQTLTAILNITSVLILVLSIVGILLIPVWVIVISKNKKSDKVNTVKSKSKTTAIVLAVLFGFWSWLYTYDYASDKKRFWINLYISVLTLGLWSWVAWIWAIINTANKPDEYFTRYPRTYSSHRNLK
jgi:uncharacterized membrane protein